jgi:hypothetical protein
MATSDRVTSLALQHTLAAILAALSRQVCLGLDMHDLTCLGHALLHLICRSGLPTRVWLCRMEGVRLGFCR